MIKDYETEAEARAQPDPKELEHALEFGKWVWRVRTGKDMTPAPTALEQIAALEAQITPRMLREATLAATEKGGMDRLKAIDDKIRVLRKQL